MLDELGELIYVSNPLTYELLYVNKILLEEVNCGDYTHKKCYSVLQNRESPCDFCTNTYLTEDRFYIWEHKNTITNRFYYIKDKLINWNGTTARLEVAIDITERESVSQSVQRKLETEQTLVECIRLLTMATCLEEAIQAVLAGIGNYYQADRAYILELNEARTIGNNTYEWCARGVEKQLEFNQNIPLMMIPLWQKAIQTISIVLINDIEELKAEYPTEYHRMKHQGIHNLMAAPFVLDDKGLGYVGIDNPTSNTDDVPFLQSVSYFVLNELQKRRYQAALEYQSTHDGLTGLFNRHQYRKDIAAQTDGRVNSLGLAFADINKLKLVNDSQGHEAGDQLICRVSRILEKIFHQGQVYRMGGDEFIVLCEDMDRKLFEGLVKKAEVDFATDHGYMASIGWSWEDGIINGEQLQKQADEIMYRKKQKSKNRDREGGIGINGE